jgi:hypothetical protein
MNKDVLKSARRAASIKVGILATELSAIVKRFREIKRELLARGIVGIYDNLFAQMLGINYKLLYEEVVERECDYTRYIDSGRDILLFVDQNELVDLLVEKKQMKVLLP